jgi:hypothetical protein
MMGQMGMGYKHQLQKTVRTWRYGLNSRKHECAGSALRAATWPKIYFANQLHVFGCVLYSAPMVCPLGLF